MALLPFTAGPLRPLCEELDALRARLDRRGVLPRRWTGRLRRELEAASVAASTIMEGVGVTVDEVRRILAGERPPEVREEDRALVEGYHQAMSFVLRRADDPAFTWSPELLVSLHDRILAGSHATGAGRLRTERPAFVVDRATGRQVFLPPPGVDVPGLVEAACDRMTAGFAHPGMASGWIHVALAAIHPFRDGNGRAARVSASLAMYRGGFIRPEFTSLEEWWGNHVADYYGLFGHLGDAFDPETDVTPFLEGHLSAQLSQVRALELRERVERQIWLGLEEVAADASLPERVTNALWDAFHGRDVTAGFYRSVADVSPATATNDLAAVVSSGLLRSEGQRRGRRYLGGDTLFERLGRVLGIEVAGSPEEARGRIGTELARRSAEDPR